MKFNRFRFPERPLSYLAAILFLMPAIFIGGAPSAQGGPGGLCPAAPNVLAWSTATEVNTAGFNLYRGDSTDGPFVKVNAELIPSSQNALTGSQYQFEDKNVVAGQTYYYQLEDVEYQGGTARHGPIVIKALSSNWLCDNPAAAAGFAALAVLIVAGGVIYARRSRRASAPAAAG